MSDPVLLTADHALRDDLLRLAAAAGVSLEVWADVGSALRSWASAGLVLLGADLAADAARLRPPRRPGVHVVAVAPVVGETFRHALLVGAEDVSELPESGSWIVEILTDTLDGGAASGLVVGVVGGSGGVGASVFAAALAATWGRTCRAMLVDLDPSGSGVERILGMDDLDGTRWEALRSTTGRVSGRSLRTSLPCRGGVAVLGWGTGARDPVQPFAVREVIGAGRRGHDVVVADLPRHLDAGGEELLSRADDVVMVSGSTVTAVAAAGRVARRLAGMPARPHLVVRSGGALSPTEVATALGLPLAAVTSHQRGLEEAIDLGAGPVRSRRGSVARAAREATTRIARGGELAA